MLRHGAGDSPETKILLHCHPVVQVLVLARLYKNCWHNVKHCLSVLISGDFFITLANCQCPENQTQILYTEYSIGLYLHPQRLSG